MSADASVQSFADGGVRWEVVAPHRAVFDEAVRGRMDSVFASKDCVLKENNARAIARVRRGGGPGLFVKKYKARGLLGALRLRLRISQAHREWRNLLKARQKGLAVPEPVAMGAASRCAYLATVEIPGAVSLIEKARSSGRVASEAIDGAAALAAEAHAAGLIHKDLHLGNFLEASDGALYLADLHRARFVESPGVGARASDVGQLLYSLSLVGGEEDGERLLKEYVARSGLAESGLEEASLAEERRWGARHERRRTKKSLRDSSQFAVESRGGRRIRRRRDFDAAIDALLDEHRKTLAGGGAGLLKDSPKSRITVHSLPRAGKVVVKQHRSSGLAGMFEICARGSRLKRAWVNAHGLIARGLKTPNPLALIEQGVPWNRTSWLVCEYLENALPLDRVLQGRFGGGLTTFSHGEKARLLAALAGEVRRLHQKNIFHKDMKANNILVFEEGENASFYFLDLDRVRFEREMNVVEIASSLAALNAAVPNFITLTDRLLFYKAYRGIGRLDAREKEIVRRIVRRSIERKHFWRAPGQSVNKCTD